MKRFAIVFCIVLIAVVAMTPLFVRAEAKIVDMGKWQNSSVTWTLYDNGTLAVTGKGTFRAATYYPWGYYQKDIKTIVIGDGITNVPDMAFAGMDYVEKVKLGNSVRSIDEGAFVGCVSLSSISFPSSLEVIKGSAFANCTALERVYFAENGNLTRICNSAFKSAGLVELTTPKSLRTIENAAFYNCASLQSVTLTDGLVELGGNAFSFCPELKRFYIGATVTKMGECVLAESNNLEYLERHCDALLDYTENGAPNLRVLVLGKNVKSVRYIQDCPKLETVIMDDSIKTIGQSAFVNCPALKQVRFPASLESIGTLSFSGSGLVSVCLPDTLKEIGAFSFNECPELTYVHVGSNLETIDRQVFSYCPKLEYVDLGNVKNIGLRAFNGCKKLTHVVWPDELELVSTNAFSGCDSLQTVQFAPSLKLYGSRAFSGSDMLSTIIFQGDFPGGDTTGRFSDMTVTVYYPADNPTYTAEVMKDYGGTVTWVPLCVEHMPQTVTGQENDCVTPGLTDGVICGVCGLTMEPQHIIAPKEHVYDEMYNAPSCSQLGHKELTCKDCGFVYRTEFEGAVPHRLLNWVPQSEYKTGAKCEDCDFVAIRNIPGDYRYQKDPNYKNTYSTTKVTTKPSTTSSTAPTQISTQPTPVPTSVSVTTVPNSSGDGAGEGLDPLADENMKFLAVMLLAIAIISLVTMGILIYIKLTKKDEKE